MKIKTSDKRKEFVPFQMTIEFESEKEHKLFLRMMEFVMIKFVTYAYGQSDLEDTGDMAKHLSEMALRLYTEMNITFGDE